MALIAKLNNMANTGLNQAVVAYKVRASDNAPLDTDDNPITVNGVPTGRKQAIAILAGTTNPNPALYDVEFTYLPNAPVEGTPTVEVSDNCPVGFVLLSQDMVVLQVSDATETIIISSSGPWTLTGSTGIATVAPTTGPKGQTTIVFTRTATLGQAYFTFTNNDTGQTARVYVVNVDTVVWILDDGTWNMQGFWFDNGIWNY